jgi:hypothetical protein
LAAFDLDAALVVLLAFGFSVLVVLVRALTVRFLVVFFVSALCSSSTGWSAGSVIGKFRFGFAAAIGRDGGKSVCEL